MSISPCTIDIRQLEQDLTAYFAAALSLTVDAGIFRAAIPENMANGVCVRIVGHPAHNSIDHPTFNVQVLGKFAKRDDAWEMIAKITSIIPSWGTQTTNFVLVNVLPDGDGGAPYEAFDHGVKMQYASINMKICVLTRPALIASPTDTFNNKETACQH